MNKLKSLIEDIRAMGPLDVLRSEITYMLLGVVSQMNTHKDRVLAANLREMANDYDPAFYHHELASSTASGAPCVR